jgi:WD40 repeat protein
VIPNVVGFGGWAPDGQHIVLALPEFHVFDLLGNDLGTIPAFSLAWAGNDQLAGFGDFSTPVGLGQIRLFDIHGNQIGAVPTEFDDVRFAPGTPILAGIEPASGNNSVATKYRIWDGQNLSSPLAGVALRWAPDGSELAVLVSPTNGGQEGTLAVVDVTGKEILRVPGWTGDFRNPVAFSHDGLYLAACRDSSPTQYPQIHVVDLATGSVSDSLGNCGSFSWTASDALYASTWGGSLPRMWTPSAGVMDAHIPGTTAVASSDGNVAYFSSDPTVHIQAGGVTRDYTFPGPIEGLSWSPDGSTLAVVSSASADTSPTQKGSELTIIRVSQ